jgi:hypothetical protein
MQPVEATTYQTKLIGNSLSKDDFRTYYDYRADVPTERLSENDHEGSQFTVDYIEPEVEVSHPHPLLRLHVMSTYPRRAPPPVRRGPVDPHPPPRPQLQRQGTYTLHIHHVTTPPHPLTAPSAVDGEHGQRVALPLPPPPRGAAHRHTHPRHHEPQYAPALTCDTLIPLPPHLPPAPHRHAHARVA